MKTLLILLISLLLAPYCYGANHRIELEVVLPLITSQHKNQCNPKCYNQENSGLGLIIKYKSLNKYINVGIGKIDNIKNSFGDDASAMIYQLHAVDYEYNILQYKIFRLEVAWWVLQIEGYKNEIKTDEYYIDENGEVRNKTKYEDITVTTPPLPKFKLDINPFFMWSNSFYIGWHCIIYPGVNLNLITTSYHKEF